jgi:hypothetical protein
VAGAVIKAEKLVTSQHEYQIDLMGPMRQDGVAGVIEGKYTVSYN